MSEKIMTHQLNIGLIGASGKLGQAILEACFSKKKTYNFDLIAKNSIGQIDPVFKKPYIGINELKSSNLIIEVASKDATPLAIEYCLSNQIPLIIGSTGHDSSCQDAIKIASSKIPIFVAENFSLCLNLYMEIVELISPFVQQNCYIDLIEKHRASKKDTPSGTAKKIAEELKLPYKLGSQARIQDENSIHIHSIRGQDHAIEHNLILGFENELIELKHQVFNRKAYADGAIEAIEYIILKKPGLYRMKDLAKTLINQRSLK